MFARQNLVYFDNIPMYDLMVSANFGDIDRIYSPGRTTSFVLPRSETEYTLEFQVYTDYGGYLHRILDQWANRHCRKSEFGILGQGWLCQHCGDYNPSGSIECIKCGGQAKKDFLKPIEFPFIVSNVNTECIAFPDNEMKSLNVEMYGYGDKCPNALYSMANGQNIFFANGYSLESGYYLCAYCGQSVPEGETCSGCGGKRLTFQELVKLNRKCVYCGRQVKGGHVCQGCGARIKGLTFKKVFGKVM